MKEKIEFRFFENKVIDAGDLKRDNSLIRLKQAVRTSVEETE